MQFFPLFLYVRVLGEFGPLGRATGESKMDKTYLFGLNLVSVGVIFPLTVVLVLIRVNNGSTARQAS